jgi:hypothetical protein
MEVKLERVASTWTCQQLWIESRKKSENLRTIVAYSTPPVKVASWTLGPRGTAGGGEGGARGTRGGGYGLAHLGETAALRRVWVVDVDFWFWRLEPCAALSRARLVPSWAARKRRRWDSCAVGLGPIELAGKERFQKYVNLNFIFKKYLTFQKITDINSNIFLFNTKNMHGLILQENLKI